MSTPFLDNVYCKIDFDRELVFKFFTVFSLFEYALKQGGYRIYAKGRLQADWDEFIKKIASSFDSSNSPVLQDAVRYLLERPPMKQVIRHDEVVFQYSPADKNTDIENLSVYVRRVRNNLFHGGKFRYDRLRDTELIQHALTILEAWAPLDQNVYRELVNAL